MQKQIALFCAGLLILCSCSKPKTKTPIENKAAPTTEASKEEAIEGGEVAIGGTPGDAISPPSTSPTSPCDPNDTSENPCGTSPVPLTPGIIPPKKIAEKCPPPIYPEAAKVAGLTGDVKFKVTISKEGKTTAIEVLGGPPEFTESAKEFLKNCQYTPAMFKDKAVAVNKLEIVRFSLK